MTARPPSAEATASLHDTMQLPMPLTFFAAASTPFASLQTIQSLLAEGADINAPDTAGLTPLLRCLSWDYPAMDSRMRMHVGHVFDVLLASGASLDQRHPDGRSIDDILDSWGQAGSWPRDIIACERYRRSQPTLVKSIRRISTSWPKPDEPADLATTSAFFSACTRAVMDGRDTLDEVIYYLHLYPQAAGWRDKEGNTALHLAVLQGQGAEAVISALLVAGADHTARNTTGQTPREAALDAGLTRTVDILDVCVDTMGRINTALGKIAARQGHDIAQRKKPPTDGRFKL